MSYQNESQDEQAEEDGLVDDEQQVHNDFEILNSVPDYTEQGEIQETIELTEDFE
jgi:hypothetical protein